MENNHVAAFIAYARGATPEEISLSLAVPLRTIKNWIRTESWSKLAADYLPAPVIATEPATERDLTRIRENREATLKVLDDLQADLLEQVALLRAGKLTVRKVMSTGITLDVVAGLAERQQLIGYAKSIFEARYRALGDVVATKSEGEGLPAGANTIHIHLPAQVAAPRPDRAYVSDVQAITVESEACAVPMAG